MAEHELDGAWLQPVSVDTSLFVNRTDESRLLLRQLRGAHRSRTSDGGRLVVGVTGYRGVGKSIFAREVVRRFVAESPDTTVALAPEARLVSYGEFVRSFAVQLVESLGRFHAKDDARGLARLCADVEALARNTRVSETLLSQNATRYGVNAGVEGGIAGLLQSKNAFTWEQTRTAGETRAREVTVTTEMIELALDALLQYVRQWTPITVVVFFDDFDQLNTDDHRQVLKNVLRIDQCIRIVHFRSEAFFDDVRREVDTWIDLAPLDPASMCALIAHRIDRLAAPADRELLRSPPLAGILDTLCNVSGNPLTVLRWVYQFVSYDLWSPSRVGAWHSDRALLQVVQATSAPGVDASLLFALARAADECPRVGGNAILRAELVKELGEHAFLDALRSDLVRRRDREHEELGYWITTSVDLLRPSVKAKLRAAP